MERGRYTVDDEALPNTLKQSDSSAVETAWLMSGAELFGVPGEIEITGMAQRQAWLDRDAAGRAPAGRVVIRPSVDTEKTLARRLSVRVRRCWRADAHRHGWDSDQGWAALTKAPADIGGSARSWRPICTLLTSVWPVVRKASGAWIALHVQTGTSLPFLSAAMSTSRLRGRRSGSVRSEQATRRPR
jgi:hypothetical protein